MEPTNPTLGETCTTCVFVLKEENGIQKFYLAPKKQNIHKTNGEVLVESSTWTGYGDKWDILDETILDTAVRELYDESGVIAQKEDLIEVAHVNFFWPGNTTDTRDVEVTFFLLKKYESVPVESDEMGGPKLFSLDDAPFENIFPAGELIIRNVMSNKNVVGRIYFAKKDGEIGRAHV